jgi:arsenate reductase
MEIVVRPLIKTDWEFVSAIYAEGMATGIATFETKVPNWDEWTKKYFDSCRIVAEINHQVVGFAVLSQVSNREVYKGVAEVTLYVSEAHKGKHVGETLLNSLIKESETHGFWTLNAAIFSENIASVNLHQKCGFRLVGIREKLGQRHGKWHDNYLLERRSKKIGIQMKNILVLCTGNSCRSQMADGYLKSMTKGKANIYSAGIETHGLNPGAVAIMKEDGIDISQHTSNHVDEYVEVDFDYIITVCDHANENCPYIPSKNAVRLHHNFFDPSKVIGSEVEKHAAFLKAREEIKTYFEKFVKKYLAF